MSFNFSEINPIEFSIYLSYPSPDRILSLILCKLSSINFIFFAFNKLFYKSVYLHVLFYLVYLLQVDYLDSPPFIVSFLKLLLNESSLWFVMNFVSQL